MPRGTSDARDVDALGDRKEGTPEEVFAGDAPNLGATISGPGDVEFPGKSAVEDEEPEAPDFDNDSD